MYIYIYIYYLSTVYHTCVQVHELPQGHCGSKLEGTQFFHCFILDH